MLWRRPRFLFIRRRPWLWGCGAVGILFVFAFLVLLFCRAALYLR
jgi:hypothetical protein